MAAVVEDILDIPDIPVVEGTQVAAAVQKGVPMVEVGGKGLSTPVGGRVLGELSGNSFSFSGWLQKW